MAQELTDIKIIDPGFKPEQWVSASKKRLLLSAYIDYLYVSVLWTFLGYTLTSFFTDISALPPLGRWLLFGAYELLIFKFNFPSIGAKFLSIGKFKYQAFDKAGKTITSHLSLVNSWIKANESWCSMIVALLFLTDGTKSLVRWMMWTPPMPFFGMQTSAQASIIIYLVIGAVEIGISFYLFRLNMRGFFIGYPYLILTSLSTLMSWNLWDSFAEEMVIRRKTYQGLPVKEDEIEFFQSIMPEAILIYLAMLLIALTALFLKFRKINAHNS